MKLYNKNTYGFSHLQIDDNKKKTLITINSQEIKEIPDDVAEIWLKYDGVEKYVEPEDVEKIAVEKAKAMEEKIKAEAEAKAKEEVQKELEKLKAEKEALEKEKAEAEAKAKEEAKAAAKTNNK